MGKKTVAALAVLGTVVAGTAVTGVVVASRWGRPRSMAVASGAMAPSLEASDHILCWSRVPERLERGSVVLFTMPDLPGDTPFVKRVVGLPGETVSADRGAPVRVDGAPLAEPYADVTGSPAFGPLTLPEGAYFLVGDDRDRSSDSRVHGPVPRGAVTGVCTRIIAPAGRRGRIPGT
jgi:signal peptidase I